MFATFLGLSARTEYSLRDWLKKSMSTVTVTLPDGSHKTFDSGVAVIDIANSISSRLAEAAFVAKVNGELRDLSSKVVKDANISILTDRNPEALEVYRHSSAHLLALAVIELFPGTQLGIGPPIENGFYYDFYRKEPFTPEDLAKIEEKMQDLIRQDIPYERFMIGKSEGLEWFKKKGEQLKCEL